MDERAQGRRATVHDVARTAGVSLATVDRVLNGRPGVRPETAVRVESAIKALDFGKRNAQFRLSQFPLCDFPLLAFEQRRVLERNRGLRRQNLQGSDALCRERAVDPAVLQVQHADETTLPLDRQAHQRARLATQYIGIDAMLLIGFGLSQHHAARGLRISSG